MAITKEQFADLVTLRYEPRGLEFKGAQPRTDRVFFAKVARACLGMANLRDGGRVIVGVDEQGGVLNPVGLSPSDLATWRYDDVAAALSTYADPAIDFDLFVHEYNGKQFVLLDIYEFREIPILCRNPY